ncbi:hypothetical protein ACK1XF_000963 [Salmonella enterica]
MANPHSISDLPSAKTKRLFIIGYRRFATVEKRDQKVAPLLQI